MTFPRTELKIAFMTMYEEYKKAITAPRAETSTYLVATRERWRMYSNLSGVSLTIVTSREGRLDVGSKRDVAGGPTVGDGDEASRNPPGPGDVRLSNRTKVWQNPNNVEGEGIEAEPGDLWERI